MKITKELKSIIERRVSEKEKEETRAINEERRSITGKLNTALAGSEEFSNLLSAAKAWENKIREVCATNGDTVERKKYGSDAWNMTELLSCKEISPLSRKGVSTFKKYVDMQDTIIMRLTYGKDFDEAQEILKEFGISL